MRQFLTIPSGHELPKLYAAVVNYTAQILFIIYVCLVCPSFFDGGAKKESLNLHSNSRHIVSKQQTHCIGQCVYG